MDTLRWQRISRILDHVLDLPPPEREAAITAATAGDDDLERDVLAHLAADDEVGTLDRKLGEVVGEAAKRAASKETD